MVSYLLLVIIGIGIIVLGGIMNVGTDIVTKFVEDIYPFTGTPLEGATDEEANNGLNLLMAVFTNFAIIALLVIVYFVLSMSQKPVRPW